MDEIASIEEAKNYIVASLVESGLSKDTAQEMAEGSYDALAATNRLDDSEATLLALSWVRPDGSREPSLLTTHWHCPSCGANYGFDESHNCEEG